MEMETWRPRDWEKKWTRQTERLSKWEKKSSPQITIFEMAA